MKHMNLVFHAAAFKHVIFCERSQFEAVQTNIFGVQNAITAASENQVERAIFASSDKAVNSTSVMGHLNLLKKSVLPIFQEQIQSGGPLTLTDPKMPRFILSHPIAVVFLWTVMLDGLQTENKALHELVQLQEIRINVLKVKVKELETERDILISDSLQKDADPSSEILEK